MKKLAIVLALVLVLAGVITVVSACGEKYDLVYANWNLGTEKANNVERQMIKAFEEENHVKIQLLDVGSTGYDDAITASISRGNAPDVFMISNTNYVLYNQYALDISQYAESDSDWKKIPASIEEAVHYKSGIYAIPFAMHMQGFFVNVDLLKDEGADLPKDGNYTYEWFKDTVKKISSDPHQRGVIGLNAENEFFLWYASAENSDLGFYTWDGSQYHLNDPAFKRGLDEAKDFRNSHLTYAGLTEVQQQTDAWKGYFAEGGTGAVGAWNDGKIAFRWGYSYEAPDMFEQNEGDFEIRFIGIPYVLNSTATNKRTDNFSILIGDYTSVYKDTKNPELAYKLAKWMSFDPRGIAKRIELAGDGKVPNTLPMTTDEATVEKYFNIYPIDGVEQMYDKLDKAIIESTKVVPGFGAARWNATTGLTVKGPDGTSYSNAKVENLLDCYWSGGEVDFTTAIADSLNDLANKQYQTAVGKYADKYN